MSSTSHIVHHEFKVGKSVKRFGKAYAALAPGVRDDAVAAIKEKGFFNLLLIRSLKLDLFIVLGSNKGNFC